MTHEAGIETAAQEFANCWLASFDSHKIRNNEFAERIIKSYLSASGMVLVPSEPTIEMLRAADNVTLTDEEMHAGPYEFDKAVYMVSVAHAPNPFKSKP